MTVSSTTTSETFACNGVTTLFIAPFRVLEATSVQCFLVTIATGEAAPLVNGTDFTVSGVGGADTSVTTAVAYSSAYRLHVKRITPRLQETDYRDNDPFPAESHEACLDRLTYIAQEDAEVLSRALVWPDGEAAPVMPSPADRANKVWANNSDGELVFVVPTDGAVGSFALDLASDASGTKGAGMVGYAGSGFAYPTRTVGAKLREAISLTDAAAGDGTTDDAAAVQSVLSAAGGNVVDGLGKLYKVNSPLTLLPGQRLRNARFDFSSAATGATLFSATGTQGATVALAADAAEGAVSVVVANVSSFAADMWVWFESTTIFETATNSRQGEIARVAAVDTGSSTLTLYGRLYFDYTVAATATVRPLLVADDIVLEQVRAVGGGPGKAHVMGLFSYCSNVALLDCGGDLFDDRNVSFRRSVNIRVDRGRFTRTTRAGLAYGVTAYEGCRNLSLTNTYGNNMRHLLSVGGTVGINLDIKARGCTAVGMLDAGLDAHPPSDFVSFTDNYIEVSSAAGTSDGLICQGRRFLATGNTVRGAARYGIFHQAFHSRPGGSTRIVNNAVYGPPAGATYPIYAVMEGGGGTGTLDGVVIANNVTAGAVAAHICVRALGGDVANLSVAGNVNATKDGVSALHIRCDDGRTVSRLAITGNTLRASGPQGAYLQGLDTGKVVDGVVANNVIDGGTTYGLRGLQCERITYGPNTFLNTPIAHSMPTSSGNISHQIIEGSVTADLPSLDHGVRSVRTVTVTGAKLGDGVTDVSFSLDTQGISFIGRVSADDTVTVECQNYTGSTVDLASGTIYARVRMK